MFATAPIAGRLVDKVDPRLILAAGFVFFAIGTWQMTYITADYDFWELLWPQVFRGIGLMFAIIPVTMRPWVPCRLSGSRTRPACST